MGRERRKIYFNVLITPVFVWAWWSIRTKTILTVYVQHPAELLTDSRNWVSSHVSITHLCSLLLPAQLNETQDNITTENICWSWLERPRKTGDHVSPLASTGGHMPALLVPLVPCIFWTLLSSSSPADPPAFSDLPVSLFPLASVGSTVTDEGPACQSSWLLGCIPPVPPDETVYASAASETQTNRSVWEAVEQQSNASPNIKASAQPRHPYGQYELHATRQI